MQHVVEFLFNGDQIMNEDKKNLELASLLHDIGKFYQRTGDKVSDEYSRFTPDDYGENGAHAKWSAEFISKFCNDDVTDMALYHHKHTSSNYPKLTSMLRKADHHSSKERIYSEEKKDISQTPLISVFSEIHLDDNAKCSEYYVPFEEIGLKKDSFQKLIPKESSKEIMSGWNLKPDYKRLWTRFSNEAASLSNNDFNTWLALIKKYASTMPSAVYVSLPDISLFDHSKTTAAIATCRYLYDRDADNKLTLADDKDVYLAINGDISGIQSFIFKISSPQEAQSGMSKRLRGRSLYLTLLTEAIASSIVRDLELTDANILFCGGGRFTIIAPNTQKAKDKLNEIKTKINREFIERFNAELYLAIASVECSGEDLEEFGRISQKLQNILIEDKKHKFVDNLDDVFNEDEVRYANSCSVCGNLYDKHHEDDFTCPDCKSHESLGQKATNSNYMVKCYMDDSYDYKDAKKDFAFANENLGIAFKFLNVYDKTVDKLIDFIDQLDQFVDKFEIVKLNDTDFLEFAGEFDEIQLNKISFSFSFLGNTVPRYDNRTPLYFEHLAHISKGANKMGVLKMDVDNLGLIFSKGFDELVKDGESGMSISRMSTLSSQLDLFFSGFINNIASEYIVYGSVDVLGLSDEEIKNKFIIKKLPLQNDDLQENTEFITVYKPKYKDSLTEEETRVLERWEIPTIHINYSGGDDLLVLGPYDDIIKFAGDIRQKFKQWTCNNDSINLSGGIAIVSPKFPIGKAVDMAEEYLEASKSCGKDKITVFGEVVSWDDDGLFKGFDSLLDFGMDLEDYNEKSKVSKGIIYSMLKMWQSNFANPSIISDKDEWKEINTGRLNKKAYVPLYKYKLRLIKDKNIRETLDKKGIKFMPWIKIPVSWVSLRMR